MYAKYVRIYQKWILQKYCNGKRSEKKSDFIGVYSIYQPSNTESGQTAGANSQWMGEDYTNVKNTPYEQLFIP